MPVVFPRIALVAEDTQEDLFKTLHAPCGAKAAPQAPFAHRPCSPPFLSSAAHLVGLLA